MGFPTTEREGEKHHTQHLQQQLELFLILNLCVATCTTRVKQNDGK